MAGFGRPKYPSAGAPSASTPARYQVTINGLAYGYGATGSQVTAVGKALVAKGFGKHYAEGPGPTWSDADTLNYSDFQKSLGFKGTAAGQDADGVPGAATLAKLLGSVPSKPSAPAAPAFEPFPGAAFFHTGRTSPIVTAMGRRLVAEGCGRYTQGPGPSWTLTDQASYAAWQRKLGYTGSAADGVPGKASWDALKVPAQL
ncbi:peptidoglycan-binding protein [Streptomyces xanthochromogenes]